MKPVVGITLGEQAGIGPELVDKVLQHSDLPQTVDWVVLGERIPVKLGCPTPESARAAWDALEEAARFLNEGKIDAVVTAPVAKNQLQSVGYRWPGQTEFFAERAGVKDYAMCLSGEHLTVGLATIHVAMKDVPQLLSEEEILRVGKLLVHFCQSMGKSCPRIAVAGLNCHAGESGAFGDEELRIIVPAVAKLQKFYEGQNVDISGPHVPDALFKDAYAGKYDAVVCMYHDQGLIPLKMVDFNSAINITLGLPRPRVSPDHGTAFDIAGKGVADVSSMLRACQVAASIACLQKGKRI